MYRYPVEVIADMYLSRVGGYSGELGEREIGINAKALEVNTSIIPNETYATLSFPGRRAKPYFFRKKYVIVGVEENMECFEMTRSGEVVLPESMEDKVEVGSEVLINTVEFFRIDGDYSKVFRAMLWRLISLQGEN
ncbi:MAG: hypothetical protein ABWW66_01655 [Archaeoglobaceae archaeon]